MSYLSVHELAQTSLNEDNPIRANRTAIQFFCDLMSWANHDQETPVRACVQTAVEDCVTRDKKECALDDRCTFRLGVCVDDKTNCDKVPLKIGTIVPITSYPWKAKLYHIHHPSVLRDGRRAYLDATRTSNVKFYYVKEHATRESPVKWIVVTFPWNDGRNNFIGEHRYSKTPDHGLENEYLNDERSALKRTTQVYDAVSCVHAKAQDGSFFPVDGVKAEIIGALRKHPDARVVLCGHSRGAALVQMTLLKLTSTNPEISLDRVHAVTSGAAYCLTRAGKDRITRRFDARNIVDVCTMHAVEIKPGVERPIKDSFTAGNLWLRDEVGVPLVRMNTVFISEDEQPSEYTEEDVQDTAFLHDLTFYFLALRKTLGF